ncbi:MAG: MATE family efflux transporter [Spirochaetaceae bacterium]|jgi:putative MATE family efflux protein|nr:MATE family efflux transporter [Spirochaetaceae bacterium]
MVVSQKDQEKDNQKDSDYAAQRLGTEPVGKLLMRFSIPAMGGMLLNALYNIVDRVFVGRGVHEIALGGVSLVMPLMTISMAFAMLFGIGAANMISMRLGQGRKEDAENALNHCILLLIGVGALITVFGLLFLEPILSTLGAREGGQALGYAREYFTIILYGQIFFQVSFGLSHTSRAQGFPMVSLLGMVLGAGINTILDPIFIFVFHWGVKGAAYATIISQFCASVWVVYFSASKKAVIRIKRSSFKPSFSILKSILMFGCSNALLQFAMSAVQLVLNKNIGKYGIVGLGVPNGDEIALSGLNIVYAVLMLILMPVFGINQGAQPVLGFNYGAKKYDRVKSAFKRAIFAATCICTAGFFIAEIFPKAIVHLFAPKGSSALLEFTPIAMRVTFAIVPFVGFQIVATNMFVVTGRPKTSIFLSLIRQVIVLIPCIIIFGRIWGLYGVICAQPVADLVALCVTTIFIARELRKLSLQAANAL